MKYHRSHPRATVLLAAVATLFICVTSPSAQRPPSGVEISGREVTVPVTVETHNDRARALADQLGPKDFVVREEKRLQSIVSVKRPTEAPPVLAVLIQDDLVGSVNNEIKGLKEFIRRLPDGARVMTGYLAAGSLSVAQDFTADLGRAAESLRIVRSSEAVAPFNPYVEVIEALRRFDKQPAERRLALLLSDGLDISRGFRSASPMLSLDLDRAIDEAQRRGIALFTFYAPSVGLTSVSRLAVNYGQGSLNRLADETGGVAFFAGTGFVTFDPYLKEFRELLGRQWVITYRSTSTGAGFRRIEVRTDFDLHLHYPIGYHVRSKE